MEQYFKLFPVTRAELRQRIGRMQANDVIRVMLAKEYIRLREGTPPTPQPYILTRVGEHAWRRYCGLKE